MKRVLVTGAAGRVGGFVVAELLEHGYEVLGLDTRDVSHPGMETAIADIRDFAKVAAAVERCEAVIHLAAIPGNVVPMQELAPLNITGTANVLEAASKAGGRRVVFASSIRVYGFHSVEAPLAIERLPVDEGHTVAPSDGYGMSKAACEALARGYARRPGHDVIVLRPGGVIDFETELENHRWAAPDAAVHGPDAAAAFRLALESDRSWGVYNLVSALRYDPETGRAFSVEQQRADLMAAGIHRDICDDRVWNAQANVYCIDRLVGDLDYRPQW